jgi:hypothetical protein
MVRQHTPTGTAAVAGRPRSAQSEVGAFTGVVRELQRDEPISDSSRERVWHFRIERHDASGNRLAPVPVEMRGLSFSGTVSNGDAVRVTGKWRRGTLQVEELDDLTTGAHVRAKAYRGLNAAACGVFAIFFLAFFGFMAVAFIQNVILGRSWP